jgi:hypothetical protein
VGGAGGACAGGRGAVDAAAAREACGAPHTAWRRESRERQQQMMFQSFRRSRQEAPWELGRVGALTASQGGKTNSEI